MANTDRNARLKITVRQDGTEYTLSLNGRLDTLTSPDLEEQVEKVLPNAEKLVFELAAFNTSPARDCASCSARRRKWKTRAGWSCAI